MGKLFKKYKWMQLFLGCLLVIAGIVTIIIDFINATELTTVLSIIAAVVLFAFGIFIFLACLLEDRVGDFTVTMAISALMIALGVILCIERLLIGKVIVYFVAAAALTFGVCELIKSIVLVKYHGRTIYIVMGFIFAALGITLGILCLCLQAKALMMVYLFTGCLLIATGIVEIIYGAKSARLK